MVPATNDISELFRWLALNRSLKTSLCFQCIRVAVCRKPFFIEASLFSETVYGNPTKMSFQEKIDVTYY